MLLTGVNILHTSANIILRISANILRTNVNIIHTTANPLTIVNRKIKMLTASVNIHWSEYFRH